VLPGGVDLVDHGGRQGLGPLDVLAHVVVVEVGDVLDQIDHAEERRLRADRQLDHRRLGLQAVDDHVERPLERGAGPVHLVDEAEAGDRVLVGLPPDRLGLRLDAGDRVEDDHAAVKDTERPLDLDREVDVPRGYR
jgi:hypothetical protein